MYWLSSANVLAVISQYIGWAHTLDDQPIRIRIGWAHQPIHWVKVSQYIGWSQPMYWLTVSQYIGWAVTRTCYAESLGVNRELRSVHKLWLLLEKIRFVSSQIDGESQFRMFWNVFRRRIGAVLATFGAEKGKETFGVVPKWVPIRCRLQPSGSA